MFFLFGFRAKRLRLGTVLIECPQCHHTCSQAIARVQRWFTLFFIPIFPFSTTYVTVCSMCSTATRVDRARAELLASSDATQAVQPWEATPDVDATAIPYPPVHPSGPPREMP